MNDFILCNSNITIRILTAASTDLKDWIPYDFSTDGDGSCKNSNLPISDIVSASCTVYPYVYKQPIKIKIDDQKYINCIDAGSLCCSEPIVEPTPYFFKYFIDKLHSTDELTIFFLGNIFTQCIDYCEIKKILQDNCHKISVNQLHIYNVYFDSNCE